MTTAFVFINIDRTQIKAAIKEIMAVNGVTEVHTVAGEYDLMAVLRVKDNARLSEIVAHDMPHMTGITHTKTLIALETQSKVDLESVYKSCLK